MKATPFVLALGAVASLAFTPASFAAVSCPDRVPTAITAPGTDAGKECQAALAKASSSFVKTQLKTDAGCMKKQVPGACPSAKDTEKIQKAALKAQDAVVKACGGAGTLAALTSSYNAFTDAVDVASCTLSQNNVEGKLLAFTVNGTPGKVKENKDRDKCVKTLNSSGVKYALGVLQAVNGCIAGHVKEGLVSDLTGDCVGKYMGGTFTSPTDGKTADKLAGLLTKLEASVDKACAPVLPLFLESIYACPGASSVADFQTCLACESWDTTLDLLAQQYNETGMFVANGAGAIQAAVDASAPGDKLLIESGLYQEVVAIAGSHAGLQLVGCGGASGDRPRIDPPTMGVFTNGITATSVDDLLFQSLDIGPWPENGIFVAQADGITFRDVISDAEDISLYAVFPVQSSDVLVEVCDVRRVTDAGIYVGQSSDIVVRYNTVIENVAGLEIENSSNASVYGNYASGNTGGILIFMLPGPDVQISTNHEIFDNVSTNNNRVNIGSGTVGTVPDGTGMLVLSNDNGDFHHNILLGNDSFGFIMVDQQVINFLASPDPPPFPTLSHSCAAPDVVGTKCAVATQGVDCPMSSSCLQDQKSTGNKVHDNLSPSAAALIGANGTNPDSTPPNGTLGTAGAVVYAVFEEDAGPLFNNNCFEGNSTGVVSLNGTPLLNCP